jgi:hypothetical protein
MGRVYKVAMVFLFVAVLVEFLRKSKEEPCEAFVVLAGNLTTATLIFLGESHQRQSQSIACMEHLTQKHKQHKILVEAVDYQYSFPCKVALLPEKVGRECWGLEDKAILKKYEPYRKAIAAYMASFELRHGLSRHKSNFKTDKDIDKYLKSYIDKAKLQFEETERQGRVDLRVEEYKSGAKPKIEFLEKLLKLRKDGYSYQELLSGEVIDIAPPSAAMQEKMLADRNAGMLKGALYHQGMFRVAIVGAAHINPAILLDPEASKTAKMFLEELEKQEENYAVLSVTK